MSTTTLSFRSTTRDRNLAAVRRREAEARAAARRARERAREERRQEEAQRRRIQAAHRRIAEQESRFEALVARADEAGRRLPDLTLRTPGLMSLDSRAQADEGALEEHAVRLTAEVDAFSRQLDTAVAEAERLLGRRIATAAAWRRAADVEQLLEVLAERVRLAAADLGVECAPRARPVRPAGEAELEVVETYADTLARHRDELEREAEQLHARARSRDRANALGGERVSARGADEALRLHADGRNAAAAAALATHCGAELARHGLRIEELPQALQTRLSDALEQAPGTDLRDSITGWIAREAQRQGGVSRALEFLQCAPELVHEEPALSRRWLSLAGQLQRIASGLQDFTPAVEREYAQLRTDASRLVNAAFSRADWIQAMCEQGFEVLERVDAEGLVVVDLDHPEVWLETTEYEDEGGAFAATLELRTDAPSLPAESEITDAVCTRLAHAAAAGAPEVATEAEVIEHDRRIKRARRPAVGRKAFTQKA